jgi:hypothetical protein
MKYGVLGLAAAAVWYGAVSPAHSTGRGASGASQQDTWNWSGRVAQGRTIAIHGVNGDVSAEPATGDQVEVTARKHARRSDPDDVRLVVVEHDGGVTICAVYPNARGRTTTCDAEGLHNTNTENNDVDVDFTIRVPRGVNFDGNTVNGGVEAANLTGTVAIATVNGSARLETSAGDASAETVNGSVHAIVRAIGTRPLRFRSVNGAINLSLPAGLSADVDARTVNGSIDSDFPISVQGRMSPRRLSGRIGQGGRTLDLETVNGSIRLRQLP